MIEGYSHIMQDTPAAVWVPRAQTLSTGPVLLTWLNGNLGNLKAHKRVKVIVWHHKMHKKKPLGICVFVECSFSHTPTRDWHNSMLHMNNNIYNNVNILCWPNVLYGVMCLKCLGAQCPCMCEMSTAQATVAFILSQRNSSEQVGSVGQRKLFLCHQWALVCTRASVDLGRACTNTPTHGRVVTDDFLKSKVQIDYKNVKCVRKN